MFLTTQLYFKWKPEIRVQASMWSASPVESRDSGAECNTMKLVLPVIDDFQPNIFKKFLFPYITTMKY